MGPSASAGRLIPKSPGSIQFTASDDRVHSACCQTGDHGYRGQLPLPFPSGRTARYNLGEVFLVCCTSGLMPSLSPSGHISRYTRPGHNQDAVGSEALPPHSRIQPHMQARLSSGQENRQNICSYAYDVLQSWVNVGKQCICRLCIHFRCNNLVPLPFGLQLVE